MCPCNFLCTIPLYYICFSYCSVSGFGGVATFEWDGKSSSIPLESNQPVGVASHLALLLAAGTVRFEEKIIAEVSSVVKRRSAETVDETIEVVVAESRTVVLTTEQPRAYVRTTDVGICTRAAQDAV
eukprot:COSAG02_NODE_30652_length_547_cov_1.151786_1_plen_127_part_00